MSFTRENGMDPIEDQECAEDRDDDSLTPGEHQVAYEYGENAYDALMEYISAGS